MRGERSVFGLFVIKVDKFSHYYGRLSVTKYLNNRFCRSGGYGGEPPPDPFPNSVVKVSSADGTMS